MVSWDPRGTNPSSPVECFTSDQAADQFWAGVSIPITRAESKAYQRKTVELARRCGEVSGDLLDHISTADTARDLDALRRLVGDDKLTYVGLSYGTMIGQTYVNLFPGRVRAMVLDGVVDAVEYTTSAETRVANQSASFDAVFAKFLELCRARRARSLCARRSRRERRPSCGEGVRHGPADADPGAALEPARRPQLRRSPARHVQPPADPRGLGRVRRGPRRRRQRRRVQAGGHGAFPANGGGPPAPPRRRRSHAGTGPPGGRRRPGRASSRTSPT